MVSQTFIFGVLARAQCRAKNVLFADELYALPRPDWILGEFSSALKNWSFQLDLQYRAQDFDCDDYARFSATLAGLCHRRTPHGLGALAFGECWYFKDGIFDGHAINVAIVDGPPDPLLGGAGTPELFFFDPQTFARVHLDAIHLATVALIRF